MQHVKSTRKHKLGGIYVVVHYIKTGRVAVDGAAAISAETAMLMGGNEDNLDKSDRLSSRSVLTHYCKCTYLVFVRRQSCASQWHVHNQSAYQTRLKLINPPHFVPALYCTVGRYGLKLILPLESN